MRSPFAQLQLFQHDLAPSSRPERTEDVKHSRLVADRSRVVFISPNTALVEAHLFSDFSVRKSDKKP